MKSVEKVLLLILNDEANNENQENETIIEKMKLIVNVLN